MKSFSLKMIVQAVDRLSKPFRKIGAGVARVVAAVQRRVGSLGFDRMRSALVDLGPRLGAVGREAMRMGKMLVSAFSLATGALLGLTKWSANVGDQLAKTGRKLGIPVEALQRMRHAAGLAGLQLQTFDSSIEIFTRRAAEAAAGTGEAKEALKAIGITLEDSNGKMRGTEDLLAEIADKMQGIEDPAKRVRLAYQLFGRSGVAMINMLEGGGDAFRKAGKEAERLGLITEEQARMSELFNDNWSRMTRVIKFIGHSIAGDLMPAFNDMLVYVRELAIANRPKILEAIHAGITNVVGVARGFVSTWSGLVGGLSDGWRAAADFTLVIGPMAIRLGALFGPIIRAVKGFGLLRSIGTGLAAILGLKLAYAIVGLVAPLAKLAWALVFTTTKLVALAVTGIAAAVKGMIALAPAIIAATVKMAAFSAALLANPITWIVGAIAALAGAAYLIYRNWDGIAGFFGDLWDGVVDFFGRARDRIREILSWDPLAELDPSWIRLQGFFSGIWDAVKAVFGQAGAFIRGVLEADPIAIISRAWSGLANYLGVILSDVRQAFDRGFVQGLTELLLSFNPAALMIGAVNELVKVFAGIDMLSIGQAWIDGLWSGARDRFSALSAWLSQAINELVDFVPEWVREKLGIASRAGGGGNASDGSTRPSAVTVPSALAPGAATARVDGRIMVEFDNAPPTMRVRRTDASDGVDVDVMAGYSMADSP